MLGKSSIEMKVFGDVMSLLLGEQQPTVIALRCSGGGNSEKGL